MNKEMSRLVNGCCKKVRKDAPSSKQLKSKNEKIDQERIKKSKFLKRLLRR